MVSVPSRNPMDSPRDEASGDQQDPGGDGWAGAMNTMGSQGTPNTAQPPVSILDSKARSTTGGTTTIPNSTYKHVPPRDGTNLRSGGAWLHPFLLFPVIFQTVSHAGGKMPPTGNPCGFARLNGGWL